MTDARTVVQAMWQGGVRYFDTAPHYGLGLSERRLGEALGRYPREEYVISTKVGRVLEPNPDGAGARDDEGFDVEALWRRRWDFTAAGVRTSLAQSLERLGLDRIDVVYLHDPEDHMDVAIEEALPALVELRDAGTISSIGIGSKDSTAIAQLIRTGLIDIAMVAGRYTLLEQPGTQDVLPAAVEQDVAIVAVGVYNSGILAKPVPDPTSTYDYGTVPPEIYARAVRIADICNAHRVTLPQAALHFPLRHPAVVNVTVGIGRPAHVPATLRVYEHARPGRAVARPPRRRTDRRRGVVSEHELWYRTPAGSWNEALPIGNGSLGAMCSGNGIEAVLQINDETAWSGSPASESLAPVVSASTAAEALALAREAIARGRHDEADAALKRLQHRHSQSFLPFGSVHLRVHGTGGGDVTDYRRGLDLRTATHTITARSTGSPSNTARGSAARIRSWCTNWMRRRRSMRSCRCRRR